jgi:hypothetical protein
VNSRNLSANKALAKAGIGSAQVGAVELMAIGSQFGFALGRVRPHDCRRPGRAVTHQLGPRGDLLLRLRYGRDRHRPDHARDLSTGNPPAGQPEVPP